MSLPTTADVVVVGAGLTGVSTALHLAERRPELSVVLLEADRVAAGASGRGTGLLGPRLGPPTEIARRRDGDEIARDRHLASVAAVRHVLRLARRHSPDTATPVAGQLVVAATPGEAATLRLRARSYAALGLDVSLTITDEPWAGRTRTALGYAPAASVDPGGLTRGLAAAAVGHGVQLVEQTPALGLEGASRQRIRVLTGRGAVTSRAVVLAVDVPAQPGLLPWTGDQLPLRVSASATAPLSADLLAELGGATGPQIIAAAPLGPYRRVTRDGRIVIGGGPAALVTGSSQRRLDAAARAAWAWQRQQLGRLHPALARIEITHRWSGVVGLTRDGLPHRGRLVLAGLPPAAELWAAGGWNGHGLAATVDAGRWLAEQVLAEQVLAGERHDDPSAPPHRLSPTSWPLARPWAAPLVRAALLARGSGARGSGARGCGAAGRNRFETPVPIQEDSADDADRDAAPPAESGRDQPQPADRTAGRRGRPRHEHPALHPDQLVSPAARSASGR